MSTPSDRQNNPSMMAADLARHEKPICGTGGSQCRLLRIWGSNLIMVLVIAAATLALAQIGSDVSTPDENLASADLPDTGVIVRYELHRIWLPPTLMELAKTRSQSRTFSTFEDLKRILEHRGQQDVWYAVTLRGQQDDGDHVDLTFVRQPYHDRNRFPELQTILAAAAGNRPIDAAADSSTPSVHLLPETALKREPREVMAELLGYPNGATNP
jgi:hypothetical protein